MSTKNASENPATASSKKKTEVETPVVETPVVETKTELNPVPEPKTETSTQVITQPEVTTQTEVIVGDLNKPNTAEEEKKYEMLRQLMQQVGIKEEDLEAVINTKNRKELIALKSQIDECEVEMQKAIEQINMKKAELITQYNQHAERLGLDLIQEKKRMGRPRSGDGNRAPRAKNEKSLKNFIIDILNEHPRLTLQEISTKLKEKGYLSNSANFEQSIRVAMGNIPNIEKNKETKQFFLSPVQTPNQNQN
jgi:hypothetical protein